VGKAKFEKILAKIPELIKDRTPLIQEAE